MLMRIYIPSYSVKGVIGIIRKSTKRLNQNGFPLSANRVVAYLIDGPV